MYILFIRSASNFGMDFPANFSEGIFYYFLLYNKMGKADFFLAISGF